MNENELAALSLPPEFAVYSSIDEADCEAQVEKGLTKIRCSVGKQESQAGEPVDEEEQTSFSTGVNSFDFRYMRATELPFNQRITLPKSVNLSIEIKMQDLKKNLKKITSEVKAVICTADNQKDKS